jgi:hypothetical protein
MAGELLPGSPGYVRSDDVRRVPVQGCPGPVVSHGSTRVSVRGGFLHVAQRHPGIEGRGDECVSERMGADFLADPGLPGRPADDPPSAVPVEPPPIGRQEDGALATLADRQVDCPGGAGRERDGDDLPALAGDHQGAMTALDAEPLDIGVRSLGDAQPVEGEQGDQRVLRRRAEPRGDQQRAEFVAVQPGGMRLLVQAGPADVRGG